MEKSMGAPQGTEIELPFNPVIPVTLLVVM
jgi:hypothetical protein